MKFEPACRRMEWLDPFYKKIWEKAFEEEIPISGTFELTPRCNFECRMCYVHLSNSEINQFGKEFTTKEWIRLAQEAKEAGTTWLCITGGEPLMHPGFKEIWKEISQMGFFITLQTNASLIKNYEKLLEKFPPYACKITLYGSNDRTYQSVCGVKQGFTKVNEGIQILKKLKIPIWLVSTIIKQNIDNIDGIINYVDRNGLMWTPTMNIRPSFRGAHADVLGTQISKRRTSNYKQDLIGRRVGDIKNPPCTYCKDYKIGYWIVWNGYMRFCSFMNGPDISLHDENFQKCWEKLVEFEKNLAWPEECRLCSASSYCRKCAASCQIKNDKLFVIKEFCEKQKRERG